MINLVFLLEEPSAKAFLESFLPRFLNNDISFQCIPHEGKQDLEKSIPRKIRAWRVPDTYFVVLRDQDTSDCQKIKKQLKKLCGNAGRKDTLIRIACRELESWYLGDLEESSDVFQDQEYFLKMLQARMPFGKYNGQKRRTWKTGRRFRANFFKIFPRLIPDEELCFDSALTQKRLRRVCKLQWLTMKVCRKKIEDFCA